MASAPFASFDGSEVGVDVDECAGEVERVATGAVGGPKEEMGIGGEVGMREGRGSVLEGIKGGAATERDFVKDTTSAGAGAGASAGAGVGVGVEIGAEGGAGG